MRFLAVLILMCILTLGGCVIKQHPNKPNKTKTPPKLTVRGQIYTVEGTGRDIKQVDFEGDGVTEKISFQADALNFKIFINDASILGNGDNLDGFCKVVDIDSLDKFKEIAVGEAGPSGDYATAFYYFDGARVISMGKIQGSFYEGSRALKIDGSGIIRISPLREDTSRIV